MPRAEQKTIYQIAHDSAEMLDDLVALTELLERWSPKGVSIHFESVKTDFGYIIVESDHET